MQEERAKKSIPIEKRIVLIVPPQAVPEPIPLLCSFVIFTWPCNYNHVAATRLRRESS